MGLRPCSCTAAVRQLSGSFRPRLSRLILDVLGLTQRFCHVLDTWDGLPSRNMSLTWILESLKWSILLIPLINIPCTPFWPDQKLIHRSISHVIDYQLDLLPSQPNFSFIQFIWVQMDICATFDEPSSKRSLIYCHAVATVSWSLLFTSWKVETWQDQLCDSMTHTVVT